MFSVSDFCKMIYVMSTIMVNFLHVQFSHSSWFIFCIHNLNWLWSCEDWCMLQRIKYHFCINALYLYVLCTGWWQFEVPFWAILVPNGLHSFWSLRFLFEPNHILGSSPSINSLTSWSWLYRIVCRSCICVSLCISDLQIID